jgi:hypothetical protein
VSKQYRKETDQGFNALGWDFDINSRRDERGRYIITFRVT